MMGIISILLGNPWARLIAVAVFCFGFGFVKGFDAVPRVDVAALERNTISARDAFWQQRLNEETASHEERIASALEAGQTIAAVPDVLPDRVQLCGGDTSCREHKDRR